jgi:hypothetical protein
VDRIQPFDLVIFLALLAMFVVGYAQGVVRRLLGIAAILFSLVLGASCGSRSAQYLANEWTTIAPSTATWSPSGRCSAPRDHPQPRDPAGLPAGADVPEVPGAR